MTCLIIDDESHARAALRGILEEKFPEMKIVGECKDVPEAVRTIQALRPQLIFLDIEMPEYNGFDLLSFFRSEQIDFQIIFVTAYSDYALQAFEISAVDYLLKPVRAEQLQRALAKVKNQKPQPELYSALQDNIAAEGVRKIVLQNAESIFVVKLSELYYLEAEGSYTTFYSEGRPPLVISKKISDFDFLEKEGQFFRSHRSYLINLNCIRQVSKKDFTIEMENGRHVALAQERKKLLLERLGE